MVVHNVITRAGGVSRMMEVDGTTSLELSNVIALLE